MANAKDYIVREVINCEIPIINTFLEENFHPEETILKCLLSNDKVDKTEELSKQMKEDNGKIVEAIISNFPCQVIVDVKTKKIVGVNVMIGSENPDLQMDNRRTVNVYETNPPKCKILTDYFRYMNDMIDKAELFKKYPKAKRALEFYAIAIDKNHRKRGLSTLIMEKGIEHAKNNGIDIVFGLYTSPFSKKAAERVGMKNIRDIDLLDYRDSDGSLLFKNSVPHNIASIMMIETGVTQ